MNKENWSKGDWIGFSICLLIIFSFLGLIIWWVLISNEIEILKELLGKTRYTIYLLLICLGVMMLKEIVYRIAELFYPQTQEEIELKKNRKNFYKRYPKKLAELKYEELKKKINLNKTKNKIKQLKDEK